MTDVHYSDMADRFRSKIVRDPLIYTVEKYPSHSETIIYPGKIGEEYHRTRGHTHINGEREIYRGISGVGKIIQVWADGTWREANINADTTVIIDPYAFHFAMNTGDEPLEIWTETEGGVDAEKDYTVVE